jgi:hypothetical protein
MNEPYRYNPPIVMPPSEDERYLKVLSVCHYVCGGLVAFMTVIPALYIALGVMTDSMSMAPPNAARHGADPGAVMGGIFIALGIAGVVLCLGIAAMLVFAGRALAARNRSTLIIVSACVMCMWVPIGTVLGVFTLVLMQRPGMKALFNPPNVGGQPAPAYPTYPQQPYPPA